MRLALQDSIVPSLRALVFIIVAFCAPTASSPSVVAAGQSQWNRIEGGAGTRCALGSDYAFFVRRADPHKLMIYLHGGGACWNAVTCTKQAIFYRAVVDPQTEPSHEGILDFGRETNPLRDFTTVFVSYCTADVHLGTRSDAYTAGLKVNHFGAANAGAVLAWTFANVRDPTIVFVTGESAGSISTPFYATRFARHYPRARVVQMGDASGAYRGDEMTFSAWGVGSLMRAEGGFESLDSTGPWIRDIYRLAARAQNHIVFAEVNAAEDSVQAFFGKAALGETTPVRQLLSLNQAEMHRSVTAYHSYILPGQEHTIILRPEFYTTVVGGIPLVQWVSNLLRDVAVGDVGTPLLSPTR